MSREYGPVVEGIFSTTYAPGLYSLGESSFQIVCDASVVSKVCVGWNEIKEIITGIHRQHIGTLRAISDNAILNYLIEIYYF